MPPSLMGLPAELHLSIFCSAEDLDDASSLSNTCTLFRLLYRTHRRAIERGIITSSPVHEYDLTLSKYLSVTEGLAAIYLNSGRTLPDRLRPKESTIVDCMNTTWTKETLTDEVVEKIASLWRQSRYLRQLYLDKVVSKAFNRFRIRFASRLSAKARGAMVTPGLAKSPHPYQTHCFGHDFKLRFHKSVCLLSISIASRNLAKLAVVDGSRPSHPEHLKDLSDQTSFDVHDTWSKVGVIIGGERRDLSLDARLDCLEVFDFLYLFLLRKIMPVDRLEDWTAEGQDDYWASVCLSYETIDLWYSLLQNCRWALQPYDLVDLVKHQAWTVDSCYPQDKGQYLQVRGVYDTGADNDSDWYGAFERSSMVDAVHPRGSRYRPRLTEDCCWWDQVRLDIGPPFQPAYTSKFLAHDKVIAKRGVRRD